MTTRDNTKGRLFLNDQETAVDLLYHEAIAKTVVTLIRNSRNAPVTVGVHGDWGAGKSSILKMIQAQFGEDKSVLCLWFNGWTFEGFEDAKTVVIETIIDELLRARPRSQKIMDAAKKVLKRVDWLKVAKKLGGFAFTAFTGVPRLAQLGSLHEIAGRTFSKPDGEVSIDDLKAVAQSAGECFKDSSGEPERLPAHMHAFREDFSELLKAADIDQLIVVVDDLDRCLPQTAIATLEAIRLFLFVPKTAFVIGADEQMIEYAVRAHFPDLPASGGLVPYARNYLEKLIQVPFRIPALGGAETRTYVLLLCTECALGSKDERFLKLLEAARADLRRPWASLGLDRNAIEKAIGAIPPEVTEALTIATQVTKVLTEGTRGNPRQIKRFLNALMLREAIAEARGFEAEIKRPVLAKIMLAERFAIEFYEQLARLSASASNGKAKALGSFESLLRATPQGDEIDEKKPKRAVGKAVDEAEAPEIDAWKKDEWVKIWSMMDPPLGDTDLRPYIFVTRDKRGLLGVTGGPSHLESLVERLLGPRIMAQKAAEEVGRITLPDAVQVFDLIRAQILQSDNLSTEPKGVQGLLVLIEYHPSLERKLVTFLRELPPTKIGAWAASKWGNSFKDEGTLADFKGLLEVWSQRSDNSSLRAAAMGVIAMSKA